MNAQRLSAVDKVNVGLVSKDGVDVGAMDVGDKILQGSIIVHDAIRFCRFFNIARLGRS